MKKIIRQIYYYAAAAFLALVQVLPLRYALSLGGYLGFLAYYLVADARRVTRENLAAAFPEKNRDEIDRLARNVFVNQGKNLIELFSFPKLKTADTLRMVNFENMEAYDQAFREGKGVLMASAHCGNWEMLGAALGQSGYPVNAVARHVYIEGLNRMLVSLRAAQKIKVILRSGREAARQLLRSLRNNETLAMLIDQDTDVPGVFVDFFGKPAWTPSGLATLALRTGAPVVVALDVRLPDDRHQVMITGPVTIVKTGDMEKDTVTNTQNITAVIEGHIRSHPDQWVWMHRRWKTRRERAS